MKTVEQMAAELVTIIETVGLDSNEVRAFIDSIDEDVRNHVLAESQRIMDNNKEADVEQSAETPAEAPEAVEAEPTA